ncbi:hypothetical protein D6D10_06746 [Aureobasidium pullulans]|uniref:DnaJ homologue subfamily C member 28 conserved domain-containing protein n=1 Tax=Aureobasidium pullulans TaxID=5580 RepID=A0A4S9ESC9_AURPU|nr:hypothetical protein D6D10_06746 [Aureobasidium pullulans]
MPPLPSSTLPICSRCMRPRFAERVAQNIRQVRQFSTPPQDAQTGHEEKEKEQGAMSRRLAALSEEGLEAGGRSARKAVEEAGFDEGLKQELLERIATASFRNENAGAFAQAEMPDSASRHSRDIAGATPWSGTESVHDASLRMLNDAYKPLKPVRGPSRGPSRGPPSKIDTGRPRNAPSSGVRLANARDKTSVYAHMKELPDDEREKFRKELKERFTPGARSASVTLKGLESLANERIEDAIARGKFKNLPRGKAIERDYNASSPFINTTEYMLNRMIQRQDIVPPWIEKQQDIISTSNRFKARLRADWRRHVARSIASRGGSLESQVALAEEYARAEAINNPQAKKKAEIMNTVDNAGHLTQVTLEGEINPSSTTVNGESQQITITETPVDETANPTLEGGEVHMSIDAPSEAVAEASLTPPPRVAPFRDADWLRTEKAYHQAAIENLNQLTRSYNLMCPALAQRPYFFLDRELNACYAEIAPQVADAIRERAVAPKPRFEATSNKPVRILGNLAGPASKVYDEQRPQFGFRDLWREWFSKK